MKCPYCGNTIETGEIFCSHCGHLLPEEQEQANEAVNQKSGDNQSNHVFYEKAKKLMMFDSRADYEEALGLLKLIPGYKDSEDLAAQCRERIEGIEVEEICFSAERIMDQNTIAGYREALELLKTVPRYGNTNYKNVSTLEQRCREGIELIQKEKIYLSAITAMEKNTVSGYEEAWRLLESISGNKNPNNRVWQNKSSYKDTNELLEKCKKRLAELKKEENYQSALKSMESGNYKTAWNLLEMLPGYKDADELKKKCADGIETEEKDKQYRLYKVDMAKDSLSDCRAALHGFEKLSGWRDADELASECRRKIEKLIKNEIYDMALSKMAEEKYSGYKDALTYLKQIPGYKDADELTELCEVKIKKHRTKRFLFIELIVLVLMIILVWKAIDNRIWLSADDLFQDGYAEYQNGNYEKAIKWFRKAADKGHAAAQNYLGKMYSKGEGVDKNFEEAYNWYIKAFAQGQMESSVSMKIVPILAGWTDTITFGVYEQDNDLDNGKEPIEWQVLAVENDKALVISKYGLDYKPYNEKKENITWAKSTLRLWLNENFYKYNFNKYEKAHISVVMLQTEDFDYWITDGEDGGFQEDTRDNIFLLSERETNQYFGSKESTQCKPTPYAKLKEKTVIHNDCWWLRNSGSENYEALFIGHSGQIYDLDVNKNLFVRPAFWLSL